METDVLTHKLFSKFTVGSLPNFPIYEISRPFSVCDVRKNPALLPHLTSFNQSNNSEKRRIIFSNFGSELYYSWHITLQGMIHILFLSFFMFP